MKKLFLLFSIYMLVVGKLSAQADITYPDSPFTQLVWSDEFDGTGLPDPVKWGYETGFVRNGELQYYTEARDKNVFQQDGYLYIRAINNDTLKDESGKILNETTFRGEKYYITSGSVITKHKEDWRYGRIEVRAKNPNCLGTWPAIWMMPTEDRYGTWPHSGEIDIMEHVGLQADRVHFTAHTTKYNANKGTLRTKSVSCPDSFLKFYVYALEWYPDRLDWFLNGEKVFTFARDMEGGELTNDSEAWPFKRIFYLILNQAFGGGWGGQNGVDVSELPQDFIIDYVRVYQEPAAGTETVLGKNVSLYPNPVNDVLNIEGLNAGIKEVNMVDITGRIIKTLKNVESVVDLSGLSKGYYVVKLRDGNDNFLIRQIIKN